MVKFVESLSFNDVLLQPKYSTINSRSEVDISVKLNNFKFKIPLLPANMASLVGEKMCEFMYQQKGMALHHRFASKEDIIQTFKNLENKYSKDVYNYIGVSVGVKEEDYQLVDEYVKLGIKIIVIDVAHGDHFNCHKMTRYISSKYPEVLLISGNVATGDGAYRLWEAGADVVKVNVGAGSLCTTRVETGAGVAQLSALLDVWETKKSAENKLNRNLYVMSDGGMSYVGDLVKSLCFSDIAMSGHFFAGTEETPGEVVEYNGMMVKGYNGSSTHKTNHIEGVKSYVKYRGPMSKELQKILEGLQSGCSYQGAHNLSKLKVNPTLCKITHAGLIESHPHNVIVLK
jgi:IMP dehydrogenase/GMP reductase